MEISVSDITVALALRPDSETAEAAKGEVPEVPQREFTGEERTVTVSKDTLYSRGGEDITFDDINVDDMVVIVSEGDIVMSVNVMEEDNVQGGIGGI